MVSLPDTLKCGRLVPVGLDQGSVGANDHPANKLEMPRVPDWPPGLGNLPGPGCSLHPDSLCPPAQPAHLCHPLSRLPLGNLTVPASQGP